MGVRSSNMLAPPVDPTFNPYSVYVCGRDIIWIYDLKAMFWRMELELLSIVATTGGKWTATGCRSSTYVRKTERKAQIHGPFPNITVLGTS